MTPTLRSNLSLLFSTLGSLLALWSAQAQTFTLIADNQTPVPGGSGTFAGFYDNRAIHQGQVVFIGLDSTGAGGIYSFQNGQLAVIADTHTTVPGTTSLFSSFNDVDIAPPVVAFTGNWPFGNQGVFLRRAHGALRAWATTPTTGKNYFQGLSLYQHRLVVTGGDTSVDGFGEHSESLMSISSQDNLRVLLDTNTPKPEGGTFAGYDWTVRLAAPGVVFTEIIPGTWPTVAGVYQLPYGSRVPLVIVDQQTPVPNESGTFQGYLAIDWDGGDVAFCGIRPSAVPTFLYAASSPSTVRVIVDSSTPVPGESANFTGVLGPIAYEGGIFVFWGLWGVGQALFTSHDGIISRVLRQGDQLNGRTVASAFCSEGGKDGNQLLVRVLYTDSSYALYLVDLN